MKRMIRLFIDGEVPSQNVTDRMHWRERHNLLSRWRFQVRQAMTPTGFPMYALKPQGKVSVAITAYRRRKITDHANIVGGCKGLIDALTYNCLIVDDSEKWATFSYDQRLASHPLNPFRNPNGTGRIGTVVEITEDRKENHGSGSGSGDGDAGDR